MPRDENRPRPFRATFSFHLPAAKSCWLRAARLHRRRLHFRRASGSRALESFDYPVSSSVPLRSTSWTYVCLVCVLICVYIYVYILYVCICMYIYIGWRKGTQRKRSWRDSWSTWQRFLGFIPRAPSFHRRPPLLANLIPGNCFRWNGRGEESLRRRNRNGLFGLLAQGFRVGSLVRWTIALINRAIQSTNRVHLSEPNIETTAFHRYQFTFLAYLSYARWKTRNACFRE